MEIKFRKSGNSEKKNFDISTLYTLLLNKVKETFKYKPVVYRNKANFYHEELLKESFDSSGITGYKNGFFVTRNGECFKPFKLEFLNANGLEESVEFENHNGLIEITDILSKDYAIIFPQECKYNLQNSIDFYTFCLDNEESENRREVIKDNLLLMKIFNENKYVSMILFIQPEDIEKFKKIACMICNVVEYNIEQALNLFDLLNNEMV